MGALIQFFTALANLGATRLGQMGTALVRFVRMVVITSAAIVAGAIGLAIWLDRPTITLVTALAYLPVVIILSLNRRLMPSAILMTLIDIVRLRVGGYWQFHAPWHQSGIVEYTGPEFPGNMVFLQTLGKVVFWNLLLGMILLFVTWFSMVTGAVLLSPVLFVALLLWLMLRTPWGAQSGIPAFTPWVLAAAGLVLMALYSSAYYQTVSEDVKYADAQVQRDLELKKQIRAESEARLKELDDQIRAYTRQEINRKPEDGTRHAEELNKWLQERERIMERLAEPLEEVRLPQVQPQDGEAQSDRTAAVASSTSSGNKPGGSLLGNAGRSMGNYVAATGAWVAGLGGAWWSYDRYTPIAFWVAVAMLGYLALFFFINMWDLLVLARRIPADADVETMDRKTRSRKQALRNVILLPVAMAAVVLIAYPLMGLAESQARKVVEAKAVESVAYRPVVRDTHVPMPRAHNSRTRIGGRVTEHVFSVRAGDLRDGGLYDSAVRVDGASGIEILVSESDIRNSGKMPCGPNGCAQQEIAGELICPGEPHMAVIAQVAAVGVDVIGQVAKYPAAMLPSEPGTLWLGVNQVKDPAAWVNMEGGFTVTVRVTR